MNLTFENKCVLITGAGRGIGRELAKAFVKCKAKTVFGLSRTNTHLQKLVLEQPAIVPVYADLADWDLTRYALECLGPIDILVNNAAESTTEPFLDIKPENFDRMFNVNVKSLINVSQVVIKGMITRNEGGSIVNISSQASKLALWNHTLYGATKAAVDSITKAMALEVGQHNIRVNAVNPTVVMTDMGRKVWSDPQKNQPLLDRIPLHKFAAVSFLNIFDVIHISEVEDVVNAVLFLSSDKAKMINGVTLSVDGGFLAC
ncbi:hypothetical protein PGB90_007906 [Kerria lacca]